MKILVTGAAGFIGFHLTLALINRNDIVIGIDNLNNSFNWNSTCIFFDNKNQIPDGIELFKFFMKYKLKKDYQFEYEKLTLHSVCML